ncbi:MAG: hypothetical protein ACPL1F_00265 [bacterium]|jgi:hypothetical protein
MDFPVIDLNALFNEIINDPITRELTESVYSKYYTNPLSEPTVILNLMNYLSQAYQFIRFRLRKYIPDNITDPGLIETLEYLVKCKFFSTLSLMAGNKSKKEFFDEEFWNTLKNLEKNYNIKFIDIRKI